MAPIMNLKAFAKYVEAGYGMGRLDNYRPWLRIKRQYSSRKSKQVFCNLTLRRTNHHLLSGLEYKTALPCAWLHPFELRECLPLWPFPHEHPQSGLYRDLDKKLPTSPGLLEIAMSAGIDHGFFFGTTIPYVATTDLVICPSDPQDTSTQLRFISCKPVKEIIEKPRVRERLELERRYAELNGGVHIVEHGENLPHKLIDNLDWILPLRQEILSLRPYSKHKDFCATLMTLSTSVPLGTAIARSGEIHKLPATLAHTYFRVGVWLHRIDIDLNLPVVMSMPLNRDNGKTLARLHARYW